MIGYVVIAWLIFPLICAVMSQRYGSGVAVGALTGLLFGPLGIVALWTANRRD